jgi:parallel beta-helix repeat protein
MKRKIGKYLSYMAIALCLITVSIFILAPIRENSSNYSFSRPKTSVPFSPIELDGNAALDAWAIINSPGTDGLSWATAHVIENYEIDASGTDYGIRITNTDRYLIIRNCDVSNAPTLNGIHLTTCQNVKITECYSHDNGDMGIRVAASSYIIISDNTVRRTYLGIVLLNSENCTISNNIATNNWDGFDLVSCININVSGNTAKNNECGIYIGNSDNNTISGNTVSSNANYGGIYLESRCEYNEVYDNIVCNNKPFNILDEGQNNNIYNNTFTCPESEIPGYPLIWIIGFVVISLAITSIKVSIKNKKL